MTEDIDFKRAMEGVSPLKKNAKILPLKQSLLSRKNLKTAIHNRALVSDEMVQETGLQTHLNPAIETSALCNETGASELFYSRGGLQKKKLRELKQGKRYRIIDQIDLHGLTQVQCEIQLDKTLNTIQFHEKDSCLLIIHGKGYGSKNGAVLKTFTTQYLKQCPHVVAYCSAQPRDGGTGAVYVLLKP